MTGRRASDWPEPDRTEAEQRRAGRHGDGADAQRNRFDPLFAATLVNHIAPAEVFYARGYAEAAPLMRAGIRINLRA
ncbi:MAG: hypothetical protein ABL864_09130 [Terricaulis sp.]